MIATRVAVNLLWCRPGKVGGSEDYLVRQLLGLSEIAAPFAPTLFVLPGLAAAHPELAALYPLVAAPISGANRVRRVIVEGRWLATQTVGFRLVHHGGGTIPNDILASSGGPRTLLTIHDLQHREYPQYVHPVKRRYLNLALPRSVRRARAISVPTQFVKDTVIHTYGVADTKVVVVPHGIEPSLGRGASSADALRTRYGLGQGPILVLPAMTHPHKGHAFIVRVMAKYWTNPDLRLVFTGGQGAAEAEVASLINRLGQSARILRVGRVPAADRDGLIKMAQALVFPSEYEGFGAPVIEAMALGTPVICSDRACLSEVAGAAAEVLPLEPSAWAGALERVGANRDRLVAAGHQRVKAFSSAASAEALVIAYQKALE